MYIDAPAIFDLTKEVLFYHVQDTVWLHQSYVVLGGFGFECVISNRMLLNKQFHHLGRVVM